MKTFTQYNTLNAGKAWEIKGATNEDGAVYCPACLDKWGVNVEGEDYGAIFASDGDALNAGLACSTCNERIN